MSWCRSQSYVNVDLKVKKREVKKKLQRNKHRKVRKSVICGIERAACLCLGDILSQLSGIKVTLKVQAIGIFRLVASGRLLAMEMLKPVALRKSL